MTDNYETPDNIAQAMVQHFAFGLCLEPAAGVGAIARWLPQKSVCIEKDPVRMRLGVKNAPDCTWHNLDFLSAQEACSPLFDTVITNPPFSLMVEFIQEGLRWVKPEGRLVYLMPLDWLGARGRARAFNNLNCRIAHTSIIPGRVDYIYNGQPMSKQVRSDGKKFSGRQCTDAVFVIKPGRVPRPPVDYLLAP